MSDLEKLRHVCRHNDISIIGLIRAIRSAQDCNLAEAISLGVLMLYKP